MKSIKDIMSEEFDKKIPEYQYKPSLFQVIKYKIWSSYKSFIRQLGD